MNILVIGMYVHSIARTDSFRLLLFVRIYFPQDYNNLYREAPLAAMETVYG